MERRVRRHLAGTALLLLAPLAAQADWQPSAAEEKAYRAKMNRGAPASLAAIATLPPGVTFDVDCSVKYWTSPSEDTYVFRTTMSATDAKRWLQEHAGDPTLGEARVADGYCAKDSVDIVVDVYGAARTAELRAAAKAKSDAIAKFAASPPAPASLGVALPADATFDPECTYEAHQRLGGPMYDGPFEHGWCYRSSAPNYNAAMKSLEELGVQPEKLDNNVRVEGFTNRPPIKIVYWVKAGGPTKPLAEWQAAHPRQAAAATASAAPATPASPAATAPAPAAAPSPSTTVPTNAAGAAKDAVNKLKGLFGR